MGMQPSTREEFGEWGGTNFCFFTFQDLRARAGFFFEGQELNGNHYLLRWCASGE